MLFLTLFSSLGSPVPTWEVRGARHGSERLHSAGRAWRIRNTGPRMSFLVSASAINQYPRTLISSSRHFCSATNGMSFLSARWPEAALQRILFLWTSEVYFTLRLWKHTGRQKNDIFIYRCILIRLPTTCQCSFFLNFLQRFWHFREYSYQLWSV